MFKLRAIDGMIFAEVGPHMLDPFLILYIQESSAETVLAEQPRLSNC